MNKASFAIAGLFGLCLSGQAVAQQGQQVNAPEQTTAISTQLSCQDEARYCPSPAQVQVDRSFSDVAIDSPASTIVARLNDGERAKCEGDGECVWLDDNQVSHTLWGEGLAKSTVVIKYVDAKKFVGRPISALGIGEARRQSQVLANVRKFLPGVKVECGRASGNVGPVECSATVNPGWFQIGFDKEGNLLAVRFDGYHFI